MTYVMLLILCAALLIQCSKDSLDIREVDFSKIESSYYKLSAKSVEVSLQELNQSLLSKTKNSISFSRSEIIDQIEVGTFIVSSLNTPRADYLCRRVLTKEVAGTTINFQTESATIVQAYESFYFNSEKTNLIEIRENVSIKSLYEDVNNNMSIGFESLASKVSSVSSTDFAFDIEGGLTFELMHPNDVYAYLYSGSNEIDDNDNGIWDDADAEFEIEERDASDLETLGFYKFSFKDFGFNSMNLRMSLGATIDASSLTGSFDVNSLGLLEGLDSDNSLNTVDEIELYHTKILTDLSAISIYFATGPLLEAVDQMSLFLGLDITCDDHIDIDLGHIIFYEYLNDGITDFSGLQNDFNPKLKIYKEGAEITGGNPFDDISVKGVLGGSGSTTVKYGANIGISAHAGEQIEDMVVSGFAFSLGMKADLNSLGAVDMHFYPFDLNSSKSNESLCGDIYFGILDFHSFEDANLPSSNGELQTVNIDRSFLSSKETFFNSSLLVNAPNYSLDEGICFTTSTCNEVELSTMNLSLEGSFNSISIESNVIFPEDIEYAISFVSEDATFEVPGTFLSNRTDVKQFVLDGEQVSDLAAVLANKNFIKISVPDLACEYEDRSLPINIVASDCEPLFVESMSIDNADQYTYTNLSEQKVSYFKYNEDHSYPSIADVTLELESITDCYNNSGLFLEVAGESTPRLINEYKSYVFIKDGGIKLLSFAPVVGTEEFTIEVLEPEGFGTAVYAPILK